MSCFTLPSIAVDLYDMPIKAINSAGVSIDRVDLNDVLAGVPTVACYNESLDEIISSHKYWGDFELTQRLLKYAINKLKSKILKSNILLSVPYDIVIGPFGAIFNRLLSEAALQAGGREMLAVENITCAALGAGFPLKEHSKNWMLYSNEWCTYLFMTFAGSIVFSDIIEKPSHEIRIEEIQRLLKLLSDKVTTKLPNLFNRLELESTATNNLELNWSKSIDNKIYMIVPDSKKLEFGQWIGQYQVIYADNYEKCIIEGLGHLLRDISLFKPKQKMKKTHSSVF